MQAHEGPQQPTMANQGPQQPTQVDEGPQQPTQVHEGPQQPMTANEGQRRPTKTKRAQTTRLASFGPWVCFFQFFSSILLTTKAHSSQQRPPKANAGP